ncbi:MAG TPA: PHP domain-containing protein, partial [Solirubrobacteraceae bacterium]|nr:PHP domain-containing protein [Solirubrobacteraceae bacterium]
MSYVELHTHSAYSFLDGTSLPEELVAAALAHGYSAMALTDHDSVAGSMEWAVSAGALGLRALHGAEVSLEDGRHLTLLVADARGWAGLCRIITRAHRDTRGPTADDPPSIVGGGKRATRRDLLGAVVPLEFVLEHAEGLVCLTGCARHGVQDEATARRLLDAFGPERLRVELQRPFARHDRAQGRARTELA